ncbi:MAG: hypothetical protein GC190_14250 [Alphaproteobacteria bacterium]|nr:hypothetical protein [Alphaproteobacteria bacterium]
MRLDIWYIALALLFLLAGEVFGEWMARSHDHSVALVHSHINVIGWASFALFGLIHRAFPALAGSVLALPQFVLAVASAVFFIGGMWVIWAAGDVFGAIAGAYGLMAATVLFIIMFFQRVVFAK